MNVILPPKTTTEFALKLWENFPPNKGGDFIFTYDRRGYIIMNKYYTDLSQFIEMNRTSVR